MQYIWIIGLSAVGKKTFIEKIIKGDLALREAISIPKEAKVEAYGAEYKWGNATTRESCSQLLALSEADAVLVKYQVNYKEIIENLIKLKPGCEVLHRLVLLFCPGRIHAKQYWEKHRNNEQMRKAKDTILISLDCNNLSEAAQKLEGFWPGLVQEWQDFVSFGKQIGAHCVLEARNASDISYPLIDPLTLVR